MRRILQVTLFAMLAAAVHAEDAPPGMNAAVQAYVVAKGVSELPPFSHAAVDLNGDAFADAVVMLLGGGWCGSGGCNLLVLRGVEGGYELVSASTVTREPVRVSPETVKGWRTLIVYSKGTGDVLMPFDGARYPSNPSMQSPASADQVAAAEILLE